MLQYSQPISLSFQDCIDDGFAQVAIIDLQALACDNQVVVQVLFNCFDDFQKPGG